MSTNNNRTGKAVLIESVLQLAFVFILNFVRKRVNN